MHLLFLSLIFFPIIAMSHQTSRNASFKELKWSHKNIPIWISRGSSTAPSANSIIEQSMNEWNQASGFKLYRAYSGTNQIKFLNNFSKYGSAVVGLTEVSYSKSGNINSATIYLNEDNYHFVTTPGMASGNNIYLKDVVTHEMGHFAGLAHSEVLDSTMFYQNFAGQSELAADDIAGIRHKYDSGYGKIIGHVKGGNHIGVFGVNVQAISRKTGEAISSISDKNGYFEIGGLDINDSYYLHTSKLKNLNSLPSYLANVQSEFCPSSYKPSFFSQCGNTHHGIPQAINISSSQKTINVGEVSINCNLRIHEEYLNEKLKDEFSSYEVYNFQDHRKFEKSYVGYFRPETLDEYYFSDDHSLDHPNSDKFSIDLSGLPDPVGKNLKIRLVSQAFGNPIEFKMIVKKNSVSLVGSPFVRQLKANGTLSLDLAAMSVLDPDHTTNHFEIEIAAKKLSDGSLQRSIPDYLNFASTDVSPYLLIMSVEQGSAPVIDTGLLLSDNAACLDAPFTYAVSNSTINSEEKSAPEAASAPMMAACGTIDPPSGPGPGHFMALLSLGFFLSIMSSAIAKRGKNFLS